ncbi:MAG: hypothetical protein Q9208_007190 [Pyrenodesmia sp. 3 TL-2023]
MIVAVTDKEVWMGHFVEDTGFGAEDLDKPEDKIDFRKNVLTGISGPATGKYSTIKSEEARLNPKLGTARRRPKSLDVWIISPKLSNDPQRIHPKEVSGVVGANPYSFKKEAERSPTIAAATELMMVQVARMQAEVRTALNLDTDPRVHDYEVPDGYDTDEEDARYKKEAIGRVLFEYDPNHNGGQKSWRLLVHQDLVQEDPHWALKRAAGRGDLDALKSIISERRSDPTYSNLTADLELPLETAAKNCNLQMVSYLLDEGAIITNNVASAAAYTSSGIKAHALPVFKLFMERGWDPVSAKGVRGRPIFLYDTFRSIQSRIQILSSISTSLVEIGVQYNSLADVLHSATLTDETLARWFLDNGADVDTVGDTIKSLTPLTPLTPVMYAANSSTTSVVSLLLSRGATLNHRVLVNAIIGHGDNDVAALTMFDFLLQQDPMLIQAINDVDTIHHPSKIQIHRLKLDHGTPLHWAVLRGRKIRVEFLISKGADVKARTPKKSQTPADWAKILRNQELIDYFSALEA